MWATRVGVVAALAPAPVGARVRRKAGAAEEPDVVLAWFERNLVAANEKTTLNLISGNVTVSGDASVGAAVGVTNFVKHTEAFLGTAREEAYPAGGAVTERWALARTFYLVLAGRLSVSVDGHEVNILGPGDHLGEIAAMDWGRDFSYGRTATVVATDDVRLLAFPAAALRELMADVPAVDKAVRRVAQARLARR